MTYTKLHLVWKLPVSPSPVAPRWSSLPLGTVTCLTAMDKLAARESPPHKDAPTYVMRRTRLHLAVESGKAISICAFLTYRSDPLFRHPLFRSVLCLVLCSILHYIVCSIILLTEVPNWGMKLDGSMWPMLFHLPFDVASTFCQPSTHVGGNIFTIHGMVDHPYYLHQVPPSQEPCKRAALERLMSSQTNLLKPQPNKCLVTEFLGQCVKWEQPCKVPITQVSK